MAVHEEQSFSGAARKHFISQPVLAGWCGRWKETWGHAL
ncbi:MAG: LysR family transcriptional regulator [Enterocloster sp.]